MRKFEDDSQLFCDLGDNYSLEATLDFGEEPISIKGGVIEISVACLFRDPIKLQPTSCSIVAIGSFAVI